jgi:hypothetical protein
LPLLQAVKRAIADLGAVKAGETEEVVQRVQR